MSGRPPAPRPVETGLVVDRVGRSSVVYRIGLFRGGGDDAAAEGRFAYVDVGDTAPDRSVTAMPEEVRAAVEPLLRSPG